MFIKVTGVNSETLLFKSDRVLYMGRDAKTRDTSILLGMPDASRWINVKETPEEIQALIDGDGDDPTELNSVRLDLKEAQSALKSCRESLAFSQNLGDTLLRIAGKTKADVDDPTELESLRFKLAEAEQRLKTAEQQLAISQYIADSFLRVRDEGKAETPPSEDEAALLEYLSPFPHFKETVATLLQRQGKAETPAAPLVEGTFEWAVDQAMQDKCVTCPEFTDNMDLGQVKIGDAWMHRKRKGWRVI